MRKVDTSGLSRFQQKAVRIIQSIHGDDSARELAEKYHADNLDKAEEYTLAELVPIPAKCPKCGFNYVGRDAVRAPSLDNVHCFRPSCGQLIPHPDYPPVIDAKTRRHGLFAGKGAIA